MVVIGSIPLHSTEPGEGAADAAGATGASPTYRPCKVDKPIKLVDERELGAGSKNSVNQFFYLSSLRASRAQNILTLVKLGKENHPISKNRPSTWVWFQPFDLFLHGLFQAFLLFKFC